MVILEWDKIKYTVSEKTGNYKWWNMLGCNQTSNKKIILDSVSGSLKSGQLVAILGPSGSGKTTLIAAISQRIRGNLTGDLIYNGAKLRSEEMTRLSVFVPQTEILMEMLTLFEHIYFQSLLKMPQNTSQAAHQHNIFAILQKLGLISCRDTRVRNLSGGERKKLNLACELLTEPKIIFCDEPTTGLDSYNALSVIKTLKQLTKYCDVNGYNANAVNELDANENEGESPLKAVLCSIHQPTSDIFHEFTHIILMSHGRIMYQGSIQDAELFFSRLDFICPTHYNPAEYYIQIIKTSNSQNRHTDKIFAHYKKNQSKIMFTLNEYGNVVEINSHGHETIEQTDNKIGWCYQFGVLLYRFMLNALQSKWEKIWLVSSSLISAITIVLLYSNIKFGTQSSIQDVQGAIVTMTAEVIFTFAYAVLYDFPNDLPMIRRELGEKLYSFSAYYIANFIMIIPVIMIEAVTFLLLIAVFSNLIPSIGHFGQMYAVLIFAGITANAYGYLSSGWSFKYSKEIAGSTDVVLLGFGGFYLSLSAYSVLKYISPFYLCNEALSIIFWSDVNEIQCYENPGYPCIRNGTEVLMKFSYTSPSLLIDFIGFSVWTFVAHFIAFFGIKRQIKKDGYY